MAHFALRWILDHPAVTCVIPGARNAQQASDNSLASALPPLTPAQHAAVERIYRESIRAAVHQRW
jgi:aryl-alcohol dehydrogenase-like predicted oxidoreductase